MKSKIVGLIAVSLFTAPMLAGAGAPDAIFAFGDSLSDIGNDYILTGGVEPAAPYSAGRFSNGPVWVQDLATGLGLAPLQPSLAGGTDYAYGTAQTGTTLFRTANALDLTGAKGQISQFQAAHPIADPNALYTIWIGSNDLFAAVSSGGTKTQIATDIGDAVANVDGAISILAGEGARNFLVLTVPDLGTAPEAIAAGNSSQASALAAAFNAALVPSVSSLATLNGLDLQVVDTYALIDTVVSDPSAFGLTDVTDPCLTGEVNHAGGTPCADPSQYLFWDEKHPTAAGHAIIGDAALAAVSTSVPEPATLSLLGLGLAGVGFMRRRKAG